MLGIPELQKKVDDGFNSIAEMLGQDRRAISELRSRVDSLSTVVNALAIDTNRRLAYVEGDRAQLDGALAALGAYEESHATYVIHSINGFAVQKRSAHDCELCVAARKYI